MFQKKKSELDPRYKPDFEQVQTEMNRDQIKLHIMNRLQNYDEEGNKLEGKSKLFKVMGKKQLENLAEKLCKEDEFKQVYHDVKHALTSEQNKLEKKHILSIINTILRRKRFKITAREAFANFMLENFSCWKYCRTRMSRGGRKRFKRQLMINKA